MVTPDRSSGKRGTQKISGTGLQKNRTLWFGARRGVLGVTVGPPHDFHETRVKIGGGRTEVTQKIYDTIPMESLETVQKVFRR